MTITKIFTQEHTSDDCEGRYWSWADTDKTYEELAAQLAAEWNGWFDAVRLVEKTFDDETFKITTKVIKTTERTYKGLYWDGGTKEIIGE